MISTSESYLEHRNLLLRLSYDITGSWADAEDVTQQVYLRWQSAGETANPRAYLARMAVNAALDLVGRREYRGPFLPGPVPTGPGVDEALVDAEEIEFALAVVLQSLSPLERAAFLLHDVFAFSFVEIAEMLGRSPAAVRQLGHRARGHVQARRPPQVRGTDDAELAHLVERFVAAAVAGEVDSLVALLTEDVTLTADGGGRVRAALRPIVGAEKVARFFAGAAQRGLGDGTIERATLNRTQAWVVRRADGGIDQAVWIEVHGGRVSAIRTVRNPDKLTALNAQL